jgi:hypothetical protein
MSTLGIRYRECGRLLVDCYHRSNGFQHRHGQKITLALIAHIKLLQPQELENMTKNVVRVNETLSVKDYKVIFAIFLFGCFEYM